MSSRTPSPLTPRMGCLIVSGSNSAIASTSTTPPAKLPSWPPVNQAALYVHQKLDICDGSDGSSAGVDQAIQDQVMAEVFRSNYYQWRLESAATALPTPPLLAYSHVRTPQDLAAMLLHLQVAVMVDPTTGDLVDARGGPHDAPAEQPVLFVDLVGDRLGPKARGSVAIMCILVRTSRLHHLYLVDVSVLGGDVALDTVVAYDPACRGDGLPLLVPLHRRTVDERLAVAAGRWAGRDGAWFAPVEVGVSSLLPSLPSLPPLPPAFLPAVHWWSPRSPSSHSKPPGPHVSLRHVLQAAGVTKVFFDVRHDAHVLLDRHGIRLRGALDLQLMAVAVRPDTCTTHIVPGLWRCLRDTGVLPRPVLDAWQAVHREGRGLFQAWDEVRAQRRQGSSSSSSSSLPAPPPPSVCAPFARRPLHAALLRYAINNVAHLPALLDSYRPRIDGRWLPRLVAEMVVRTICVDDAAAATAGSCNSPWSYPTKVDFQPMTEDAAAAQLPADTMARVDALRRELPPYLRAVEPPRPSASARRRWKKKMKGLT